ncbi:PCRF domain-containing protein, partial [Planctomycetota bacterium]
MSENKDPLLSKLDELEARYVEIGKQISEPATASDPAKLIPLSKEQGKLKAIVGKYREYKTTLAGIEDAKEIIGDESADEDFKALAEEELQKLEGQKKTQLEELQNTLITADDMSVASVIMEIRAGTGGEEAALFARDLYNMYV